MKKVISIIIYALLVIGVAIATTTFKEVTTNELVFFTGGTEQVRVDSSGNVGVGTSTPSTTLDIQGSANFTQNLTIGNLTLTRNANTSQGGAAGPSNWWNESLAYRQQITFSNSASGEDLTWFPVLIVLNSSVITYGDFQAGGADIRFVDADNTTELPYETEDWNTGGNSYIWVNVPQIDAGSTTDSIWMYYGNDSISSKQLPKLVWNNSYSGVWHMNNTAANTHDSLGVFNATSTTGTITLTTGKIDGALEWEASGDDDGIGLASGALVYNNQPFTIEAWFYIEDFGSEQYPAIVYYQSGTGTRPFFIGVTDDVSYDGLVFGSYSGYIQREISSLGVSSFEGKWAYTALTFIGSSASTGSSYNLFINGTLETHQSSSGFLSDTNANSIGIDPTLSDGEMDGIIDEIRVSSTNRSSAWIYAQWLSITNTFTTIGSKEPLNSDSVTVTNGNDLVFFYNDNATMWLEGGGKLGIGIYEPTYTLTVDGNINASGSINSLAGIDLAEAFTALETLDPGDIVMVRGKDVVRKATKEDAHLAIGVVSTSPGMILNKRGISNPVLVSLAGRVPVKVQGAVSLGDYITVSDTPGVGEAALGPGFVVGRALEPASDGFTTILVQPLYFSPQINANNELVGGSDRQQKLNKGLLPGEMVTLPSSDEAYGELVKGNEQLKATVNNLKYASNSTGNFSAGEGVEVVLG